MKAWFVGSMCYTVWWKPYSLIFLFFRVGHTTPPSWACVAGVYWEEDQGWRYISLFHFFFYSKSLDPAWDPSHLRAWLCHMTYEVAKARGAATGKSHAESQPALGGCPELLTGEFPFCCTASALGGGRGEGVGAGLCTTGHVGPFFDPSIWIRACLSRL